jgi:hypothetical protein
MIFRLNVLALKSKRDVGLSMPHAINVCGVNLVDAMNNGKRWATVVK